MRFHPAFLTTTATTSTTTTTATAITSLSVLQRQRFAVLSSSSATTTTSTSLLCNHHHSTGRRSSSSSSSGVRSNSHSTNNTLNRINSKYVSNQSYSTDPRRSSYCTSTFFNHHHHHHYPSFMTQPQPQSNYTCRNMTTTSSSSSSGDATVSGDEMIKALLQHKQSTNDQLIGNHIAYSMESFINADCVCFDVDSTVIQEEGIDVLADYFGKGAEVAEFTKRAMEGGMVFQDALYSRLSILQPSKLQIESCLRDRPFRLTPGIAELISVLQHYNKDIYFISGGFRIMIEPIAKQLRINPQTNVIANTILFDSDLFYNGFDTDEYTSKDMGKPAAIQSIIDTKQYNNIVMIGDGMTDAQSKPPASSFIGFGGVIVRTSVQQMADWYITDFYDLIFLLQTFATTGTTSKKE